MSMPGNRINAVQNDDDKRGKFYVIEVVLTTAAGAGATVNTTPSEPIGPDEFLWEELGADWITTTGDWSIKITDDGDGQPFMPGYVKVQGLVGATEREPYKLRHPWRFRGGSAIMVEAVNDGTGGDTLSLQFIGKRYTQRGQIQ